MQLHHVQHVVSSPPTVRMFNHRISIKMKHTTKGVDALSCRRRVMVIPIKTLQNKLQSPLNSFFFYETVSFELNEEYKSVEEFFVKFSTPNRVIPFA